MTQYMRNAKQVEARTALVTWANGLAHCGQREGHLPPTSAPVPASLSELMAKKWQSAPAAWSEPAYRCAGFSMAEPQYFQYQWELRSPNEGSARAVADLNGDGVGDARLDVAVTCNAGTCTAGSVSGVDDASRVQLGESSKIQKDKLEPPAVVEDGASAKITFGPSPFDTTKARSGLFIVVYDRTGINGAPAPGKPAKSLPEPMCAPERVLARLTTGGEGPTTLRYALDSAQRPMWMANSQAHPKDVRLFDPQDCAVRGFVGPKRER